MGEKESQIQSLTKENERLSKKLEHASISTDSRVSFSKLKNKGADLMKLGERAKNALWFVENFGLTPVSLKCKAPGHENVDIKLRYENISQDDKKKLRKILFVLDSFSIGEQAYHEITTMTSDLPSKNSVKREKLEINERYQIKRCPGNVPRAYVTLQSEIEDYVRLKSLPTGTTIKLKVSGDGSRVSRVSNFVTISVCFFLRRHKAV